MRRNSSSAESGFVEQEDARLGDGGAGERDALLLAAGELRRETVGEFGEPDFLHHGVGGLAALGLGDAAHLQRKGDIVAHVQMGEQRIGLEHHGGAARHRRQADDVVAADQNLAGGRIVMPRDHAQDRGLAAARWAEQAAIGAVGNLEIDAVDGVDEAVEGLDDASKLDMAGPDFHAILPA